MARVNGAEAHGSNRIVDTGFVFGSPDLTVRVAKWLHSPSQPLGIEAPVATSPCRVAGFVTSRPIPLLSDIVNGVPSLHHVEEHLICLGIFGG